jgi:hypothetical protein
MEYDGMYGYSLIEFANRWENVMRKIEKVNFLIKLG